MEEQPYTNLIQPPTIFLSDGKYRSQDFAQLHSIQAFQSFTLQQLQLERTSLSTQLLNGVQYQRRKKQSRVQQESPTGAILHTPTTKESQRY